MDAAEHGRTHGSTTPAKLSYQTLPGTGKEALGCRKAAFLIFRVRRRGALPDLLRGLVQDPSVNRGLQRVGFRRHQAGRPKKRVRTRLAKKILKKGFAGASQNDSRSIRAGLVRKLQ